MWGRHEGNAYLIDQFRARAGFNETLVAVRALARQHPGKKVLVEMKANGEAVLDALRGEVPGLVAVTPTGSKEERVHAISVHFEGGRVLFPPPELYPWVRDLEDELASFPSGAKDDQVDALSQGLAALLKKGNAWWSGIPDRSLGARRHAFGAVDVGWHTPDHSGDRNNQISPRRW